MTTDLATRQGVTELVGIYEQAEADIRRGYALLAGAQEQLRTHYHEYVSVIPDGRRSHVEIDTEAAVLAVRRRCWEALLGRLDIRRFMSVAEWEALEKQVRDGECPDLTVESVIAMCEGFRQRMPEMLEAAVKEVFDWLVPHKWTGMDKYKTNDKCEVGRRVVVNMVFDPWYSSWYVRDGARQRLIALENVFTALDGKGQVTKSSHWSQIETIARESKTERRSDGPLVGETPYFRFRGFKNGNLHLEILRADLLSRFNAIAGGQRLRPGKEAA